MFLSPHKRRKCQRIKCIWRLRKRIKRFNLIAIKMNSVDGKCCVSATKINGTWWDFRLLIFAFLLLSIAMGSQFMRSYIFNCLSFMSAKWWKHSLVKCRLWFRCNCFQMLLQSAPCLFSLQMCKKEWSQKNGFLKIHLVSMPNIVGLVQLPADRQTHSPIELKR